MKKPGVYGAFSLALPTSKFVGELGGREAQRHCRGSRGREDEKGPEPNSRPPSGVVSPWEVVMRLEPKECRLQALTCERLAQRSTSPIVKGAYADLAKKWLEVADDLQAVINARAEPEPQRRTG
jgi:hypothetical protein